MEEQKLLTYDPKAKEREELKRFMVHVCDVLRLPRYIVSAAFWEKS